jgi:hypothetical protein
MEGSCIFLTGSWTAQQRSMHCYCLFDFVLHSVLLRSTLVPRSPCCVDCYALMLLLLLALCACSVQPRGHLHMMEECCMQHAQH